MNEGMVMNRHSPRVIAAIVAGGLAVGAAERVTGWTQRDRVRPLSVQDFSFEGPLGSDGASIERIARNHFKVTLGHAPAHADWPNKLNFRILRHARGNDLRLEVAFDGGDAYSFNEYHQSWSYDGINWQPIAWKLGRLKSLQYDVLEFPVFQADEVHVGTQVPMSWEQAEALMAGWVASPFVTVHAIGRSTGGRRLARAEITDPGSPHPRSRRWVHYFANQHPGEHNSQWRLVGLVDWLLSDEAADFRRRNIVHVILMMSPDAPSHGWYRVNAAGIDMNRSFRPEGADPDEQTHEPYLWQRDLEALMASDAPVTTIWAIHTWPGIVEPVLTPGPEIGSALPDWTRWRDAMLTQDPLGLIEPLRLDEQGEERYGPVSWTAGPHKQFGITAILCEGGAVLQTKELNESSGVAIIRSIADYYAGTR
jgi:Zinc carboxypeptidase